MTGPEVDQLSGSELWCRLTFRGMPTFLADWYVQRRDDPDVRQRTLFFINHWNKGDKPK